MGPATKKIIGLDPEELVGKNYAWEPFQETTQEELKKNILDLVREGIVLFDRCHKMVKKDGESIWVSVFGSPIKDQKDQLIGYRGVIYDITSRKKVEKELKKFRLISDEASYGTVITEYKTRKITYCNQTFAKMHGYEVEELIGKEIFILHTPVQLDFYFKNVFPEYEKNKEYSIKEFGGKRKDGSTFPGLVTAKLFFGEDGSPLFSAATVIDLTNQKIFDEQIKEQNLKLKAIIDAIPDQLFIMDKEGNYMEYFSSVKENKILDYGDLVGKNLTEVFPQALAANHLEKIRKAISENKIQTYEQPGPLEFENQFFESRIVPISETKVLRFVRDITQRKKDESKIRKLTLAIERSPVAIIITDLEGNLEYMSPAFLEMTGYSHEELIKKPIGMIKSGLTDQRIYENLRNTITSGKNWKTEWRSKRKNGEIFWESISITPILVENGNIKNYLAVKQDITDRKNYEEEIIQLNLHLESRIQERTRELENSNLDLEIARKEADSANLAKSEFLSRMSHELRTPMNSILGFAQLLQFTELTEAQSKNVDYILKSGNHLLQLINEVLDIAKIESGKLQVSLEPVELWSIILEVTDSVMPFAKKNSIKIYIPSNEFIKKSVIADLQRLKQILINLMNNAIKYNRKGGSIWIGVEPFLNDKGKRYIRIVVEDSGIGISKENISKLFKPFERVANNQVSIEGTGLGLAVVEKLTQLMRGKVGVESKINEGSKFWIELPETESLSKNHHEGLVTYLDPKFDKTTKGTLLLVEDSISNIELIKELIKDQKPEIQVLTTMYGLEAIQMAKEFKPSLILLDLNLPDIAGAKVLEILKADEETKDLPITVVSADATTKQMEYILSKGADQYLTKPINIRQLIKIFDLYLKETSYDQ